jgi:hypothetical protein
MIRTTTANIMGLCISLAFGSAGCGSDTSFPEGVLPESGNDSLGLAERLSALDRARRTRRHRCDRLGEQVRAQR